MLPFNLPYGFKVSVRSRLANTAHTTSDGTAAPGSCSARPCPTAGAASTSGRFARTIARHASAVSLRWTITVPGSSTMVSPLGSASQDQQLRGQEQPQVLRSLLCMFCLCIVLGSPVRSCTSASAQRTRWVLWPRDSSTVSLARSLVGRMLRSALWSHGCRVWACCHRALPDPVGHHRVLVPGLRSLYLHHVPGPGSPVYWAVRLSLATDIQSAARPDGRGEAQGGLLSLLVSMCRLNHASMSLRAAAAFPTCSACVGRGRTGDGLDSQCPLGLTTAGCFPSARPS